MADGIDRSQGHDDNSEPPFQDGTQVHKPVARAFLLHMGMTVLLAVAMIAFLTVSLSKHGNLQVQRVDQNATSYYIYMEELMAGIRSELSKDLAMNSMNLSHDFRTQVSSFHDTFSTALDDVGNHIQAQTSQFLTATNRLYQSLNTLSGLQLRIQMKTATLLKFLRESMYTTYTQRLLRDEMEEKAQSLLKVWEVANETLREITKAQVVAARAFQTLSDVVKKIPENIAADITSMTENQAELSTLLAAVLADGIKNIGLLASDNHEMFQTVTTFVNKKVRFSAASLFSHNEAKKFGPILNQALKSMPATTCIYLSSMLSSLAYCGKSSTSALVCG